MDMALISCRECNHQISDAADKCPSCGAAQKKKTSLLTWIGGGVFAIFLWAVLSNDNKSSVLHTTLSDPQPVTSTPASSAPPKRFPVNYNSLEVLKRFIEKDKKDALEGRDSVHSAIILQQDVSAQKIANAYEENEVYGDAEFFNKIIRVSGTIRSIESGVNNAPYITFDVENNWHSPIAKFKENLTGQIASLLKGQDISLVCVGAGEIAGTAILNSCEFSKTYIQNNMPDVLALITNYLNGNESSAVNYSKTLLPFMLATMIQTEIYLPNAYRCLLPPNVTYDISGSMGCMINSKPNILKASIKDLQNNTQNPEVVEARAKLDAAIKSLDEYGLNDVSVILRERAIDQQELLILRI